MQQIKKKIDLIKKLKLIFFSVSMASMFSRLYLYSEIGTINHCIVNCLLLLSVWNLFTNKSIIINNISNFTNLMKKFLFHALILNEQLLTFT